MDYTEQNKAVSAGIDKGLTPMEALTQYQSSLPKSDTITPNTTSTTSPTVNTPIFNQTGATDEQVDAARKAQYAITEPTIAASDYKTSALSAAQSRIDEINKRYADQLTTELNQQAPVNANSLGRTNALSSLMGLSGSGSAVTRSNVTEQTNANINQGITNKVNAQKARELNAIYDKIDNQAYEIQKAQLETNKENQKALLDAVAKNAEDYVYSAATTLAGTGKTFDDFKTADNGETLSKLEEQTGKSEYQLRAMWANALPEQYKPVTTTTYHDDGKGGTVMQQVSFDPVTKKATVNSYPIAVPVSTFNGEQKPIEGKNGELFIKQADGSYKDVSPNAENNKKIQELNIQKSQAELGKLKADTAKAWSDAKNTSTPIEPTTVVDENSGSILAQTGIPSVVFNYLTQGTSALTRMNEASRKSVMAQADAFLNKNGLDYSTFQSRYKSFNNTLQKNVERYNNSVIMEGELKGTLENLMAVADEKQFGKIKVANVAKLFAGEQVNDPTTLQYAVHLNQLVNELAGYNAAVQGKSSPDLAELEEAKRVIKNGLSTGSLKGFEKALASSTEKMGTILQGSVDRSNKQVWGLFGVGDKYKAQSTSAPTKQIQYQGKTYNVDANGNLTEAK